MFYRSIIAALRQWAERDNRKPLILRGARQVGKTTVVEEFAREFEVFLRLNLEKPADAAVFETGADMQELITAIYLLNNQAKSEGKTLLFIDEIQNSPSAVAMLRYFYEEAPHIHVIAAGSLLESLIDKTISFPVGRVEYMAVRPCSFVEFLGALGETELQKHLAETILPVSLHDKVLALFNTFTLIGGMPEIVANYARHRDIVTLNTIYETLLTGYRDDVEKYSDSENQRNILRMILNIGWTYAAQRITFEKFGNSTYRSREMSEAFRTLEKTMLLELSYPVTSAILPVQPEFKRSPKLLWVDTGLVNYAAGLQKELFGVHDISDAWRGRIAEHIVGQELLASDNRFSHKRYFWVRDAVNSSAEVDYIIQSDNRIIPVEVKSGSNAKLRSLHQFMENAPHDTAVRFWSQPLSVYTISTPSGKIFKLFNIPYYYAGMLDALINR
jgi:predicted AAA+ superfamily ATPase